MNFDFSNEQNAIRHTLGAFLAARCGRDEARSALNGEIISSESTWSGLANMGVLATHLPIAYGGLELGRLELCVLAEELGRVLAPVAALSTLYVFAELIADLGTLRQKERWLPGVARGEQIGTWGILNEPAGLTNGKLRGTAVPVLDAEIAGAAVVLVRDNAGGELVVVDLSDPTVSRRRLSTVDPSRPQYEVRFANTPAEVLGSPGQGEAHWAVARDRAAIYLAFEQIGAADAALAMAIDYARVRSAFGRKIASYQAIKHKLADIYAKNEIARVHAYYGAWTLSQSDPAVLSLAAASARVSASDALTFAAQENIETHGGIGFTWDSDCQLFYRRARLYALVLGPQLEWRERLVAGLCANPPE